jgi:glycerol uptake facilitator-like aquaporin
MADHEIVNSFYESLMILIFEAFGTAMLAMLFASDGGASGFFIGFYILLILSARISGSHYNPIVTLAWMLRKDTAVQFNKWLGILYMLA